MRHSLFIVIALFGAKCQLGAASTVYPPNTLVNARPSPSACSLKDQIPRRPGAMSKVTDMILVVEKMCKSHGGHSSCLCAQGNQMTKQPHHRRGEMHHTNESAPIAPQPRRGHPDGELLRLTHSRITTHSAWWQSVGKRRNAHLPALEHVDAVEILGSLAQALGHALLTGAESHAGVVVLLVGLELALGVANLALEVVMVLGLVSADAVPEGPLRVGVNVHLDGAGLDGVADVLARRTRAAMEDKERRLLVVTAELLRDVGLGVVEDLGLELDVARGVHAVNVAEGSGDGESTVGDLREGLVDLPDLLRLGVKARRVDI
mmetsp:Transcript_17568/g.49165  ORF Transcript_17568/g.49165 Transcript_17568/m.49165 type:complete len:319 (-) Transcript_17568:688-1644(-)